MSFSSSAKN